MDPRSPVAIPPTVDPGGSDGLDGLDGTDGPTLSIDGLERSTLKVTVSGIEVCPPPSVGDETGRYWPYADLADIRIAEYGAIGVIRATLLRDGTDLPLLLLEPEQIAAARRTLEIVWNRLTVRSAGRTAA